MYRNRFKLDKRSSETPITTTSTAAASSSTAESNNNPFKWSGGGGENEDKQQITLKPVLPIVVKKKLRKQNEKVVYCTYYNRDGFCRNGSGCRFVHEKSRIRTCPEFVKTGSCTQLQPKCHLRHRPDPHTMESCLHFRRGMCHRGPACPYPHINVDDNARVCLNFQQGYCSKGAECTLKHVKKKAAKKTDELEHLRLGFFWGSKKLNQLVQSKDHLNLLPIWRRRSVLPKWNEPLWSMGGARDSMGVLVVVVGQ